jgi:hypothetical protein
MRIASLQPSVAITLASLGRLDWISTDFLLAEVSLG